MSRPSAPWFRASKNTWYCTCEGRKVSLGVRGVANEAEAIRAWHRLFAGMPLQSPEMPKESPIVPQAVPMVKTAGVSVGDVMTAFLADAKAKVKEVTWIVYERFCRFFKLDNGKRDAESLTPTLVETWARKPAWSSSTRHDAIGIVETAFRWAERSGLLSRNPLHGVRKPPKASRGAKALISADEHARLVACADPQFGAFLKLLWLTGARPSEIAGLKAEDVDYVQGIAILSEHKCAHLGKSRVLFLLPDALAIIKSIGRESGLLFVGEDGQQMTAQAIGKRLRRLCVKAGMKACTPYGYRHSWATDALARGVADAMVAGLLGHSSTAMLYRNYSHLTARSQALREALGRVR